jgi:hypothetical protein
MALVLDAATRKELNDLKLKLRASTEMPAFLVKNSFCYAQIRKRRSNLVECCYDRRRGRQ